MFDWGKYLISKRLKTSTKGNYDGRGTDKRNPYDSDFGRVVFSSGLRRMHDKTQVIPLTNGDYVHTRLTHSIEVMNIATSIAENICRRDDFQKHFGDVDPYSIEKQIVPILRTAAIMHDVGNPPFGHFGEAAIQNFFKVGDGKKLLEGMDNEKTYDFTQFDGNAQGFRIMTKLQYLGDLYGLNLTVTTLAAYTKYPNCGPKVKGNYIGLKKHGIMFSEKDYLDKMVQDCNLKKEDNTIKRHPLSFIVEAADSICYNTMDMEDGISLGWFETKDVLRHMSNYLLKEAKEVTKAKEAIQPYLEKDEKGDDYVNIYKIIGFKTKDENGNDIIRTHSREIVDLRVAFIDYFVSLAVSNFINNLDKIDEGSYSSELIEDDVLPIAKSLADFCRNKMFTRREIRKNELTGEAVIHGLLGIVLRCLFSEDEEYRNRIISVISDSRLRLIIHESLGSNYTHHLDITNYPIAELDPYQKIKLAIDWITSMTDRYALDIFLQLSGHSL